MNKPLCPVKVESPGSLGLRQQIKLISIRHHTRIGQVVRGLEHRLGGPKLAIGADFSTPEGSSASRPIEVLEQKPEAPVALEQLRPAETAQGIGQAV